MKRLAGLLCLLPSLAFAAGSAKVFVGLSPAGDFTAKTVKVRGFIEKIDGTYHSRDINFKADSLDSEQDTRNEHMWKELGGKDAKVEIKDAKGSNGRGNGFMVVKGISKPISFTYVHNGDKVLVKFPVRFSHWGIKSSFLGVSVEDEGRIEAEIEVR